MSGRRAGAGSRMGGPETKQRGRGLYARWLRCRSSGGEVSGGRTVGQRVKLDGVDGVVRISPPRGTHRECLIFELEHSRRLQATYQDLDG